MNAQEALRFVRYGSDITASKQGRAALLVLEQALAELGRLRAGNPGRSLCQCGALPGEKHVIGCLAR